MDEGETSDAGLPRLLVLSDVNAERTVAGSLLVYRLLRTYPADRLMIVSYPMPDWRETPERLPGVRYHDVDYRDYRAPRVIFNRFNPFWPVVMAKYVHLRTRSLLRLTRSFEAQAVLSVAHGYLWFAAEAVARELGVPFHLILHDDWPYLQTGGTKPWVRPYAIAACARTTRSVCRRAARVYAVSPGMAELYERELGVKSEVLYPSRGEDSAAAAVRVRSRGAGPLVVAYAGMIPKPWTAEMLRSLATVLEGLGGRLDLYVPYDDATLAGWGLDKPNVRRVGFFVAHEMATRVAASADVLFLPASFEKSEQRDVSTLFPSKLADYTAIGLPILVWAPAYSSAARWVSEGANRGELVTDPDPANLLPRLRRLASDPEHALGVARGAVEAGVADFDPAAVRAKLFAQLRLSVRGT